MHACFVVVSQTRPDEGPPQSLSFVHPHVSLARQTGPMFELAQSLSEAHSTQWFILSQTCGLGQSGLFKHCTQLCGCVMVSQTGFGAEQSAFLSHGCDMHWPTVPSVFVQYFPVAQLIMPFTTRHPGVQTPVAVVDVSQ
jgi:hypothetical protein